MANDRVMMRCDGCGAWMMFLKHYPGQLGTYTPEWSARFISWVDQHCQCHPHFFGAHLHDLPGFSLHCEGAPGLDPQKQNAAPPT